MRHYFDFGPDHALVGDDLARPEAWDALRTSSSGAFALPDSRDAFERAADERLELAKRARSLDERLEQLGVGTLASYGVGSALLELWLHRLRPDRRLRLTDYAPQTVERLGELFPAAEISQHDLVHDPPLDADIHLLHRVDTELSNRQWRELLRRLAPATVLVVATEVATVPRLATEAMGRLRRRHLSRAGWLRTRSAFEGLWSPTHDAEAVVFHDLEGWVLRPRSRHNITAP
jgi:hypothetical protein